jgi:hypothetical protein
MVTFGRFVSNLVIDKHFIDDQLLRAGIWSRDQDFVAGFDVVGFNFELPDIGFGK